MVAVGKRERQAVYRDAAKRQLRVEISAFGENSVGSVIYITYPFKILFFIFCP